MHGRPQQRDARRDKNFLREKYHKTSNMGATPLGVSVVAAATIGVFMTTPGQTVGVSSFVDLLANDLSLSRERVLLLYSLGTLLGILPAPLIGRMVDRFGPRRMVIPVVVTLAAACLAMSLTAGAWTLGVAFVLLRGAAVGGLSLVSLNMVNLWFDKLRGRMTAVAMIGLAAGGSVIPTAAEMVIRHHGWRSAYVALATAVLLVMLPVGVILFRNRPDQYNAQKDFGRALLATKTSIGDDQTLREALTTLPFWYIVSIGFLINAVGTALLLDHVRMLEAAGTARATAIQLLGIVTLSQALAILMGGALVDHFGARRVGLAGVALLVLAVASAMAGPTLANGVLYAAALGASIGILQLVASAALAEAFGTAHLGTLRGTTFMVGVAGAAAGPLPFVWSSHLAYWIFLSLAGFTTLLGILSRKGFALER